MSRYKVGFGFQMKTVLDGGAMRGVFNEQRIEFTLMPDFLATSETPEHPHTRSRLCLMFGPEPVAMETISLDRHPQCTSWQRQLEPSCRCGEGNSLGSTASPWRSVQGQADFRSFSKDIQPDFGGGSFLFIPHCHGTAPHSFVCLSCTRFMCSELSALRCSDIVFSTFWWTLAHQAYLGSLGFSSQATALLTTLNFSAFFRPLICAWLLPTC